MGASKESDKNALIFIGIGANLPSPRHGPPRSTCEAALTAMTEAGLEIVGRSRWYRSTPVPASRQPWYVNGVAQVASASTPARLLELLLGIEAQFGRRRREPNAPRILDLDLLAFGDVVTGLADGVLVPHPRMHERAFVLRPLMELAPGWRHPVSGLGVGDLIAALPPGQAAEPMDGAPALPASAGRRG